MAVPGTFEDLLRRIYKAANDLSSSGDIVEDAIRFFLKKENTAPITDDQIKNVLENQTKQIYGNLNVKVPENIGVIGPTDRGEYFKKFDRHVDGGSGHVLFGGSTGSGKTTAFITAVYKEQVEVGEEIYIFMSLLDSKNLKNISDALTWSYMKQNKDKRPKIYVYYDTPRELQNMIQAIKKSGDSTKTVIIEDVLANGGPKSFDIAAQFIHGAKNNGCQVFLFYHLLSQKKIVYQSFSYIVLVKVPIAEFNAVILNKVSNDPDIRWGEYEKLDYKYRVAIFERVSGKLFKLYGNKSLISAGPVQV